MDLTWSLNPPLMLGLWGTFRGVERGKADFGAFCCCKHGKNMPAVFSLTLEPTVCHNSEGDTP